MQYYFCSMAANAKYLIKNNYKYKICIDGYEKGFATYVYIKQPGSGSLIELFHQTLPYKMGYAVGTAFNMNNTAVCENFSGNNRGGHYFCTRKHLCMTKMSVR
jgi:hypothetical protein